MPALVSHQRFAAAALTQAQPYLATAAAAAPGAFHWGAQGPDILFYHQPLLENRVSRVAHRIHEQRVARFFAALTAQCAKENTPEATAYLLGFCCHYILDRTAHPFVTYMANYRLDPLFPELPHSAQHNLCEAELDRALLEHTHPGSAMQFRAHLMLSADERSTAGACALLPEAIWQVYGTRVSASAVRASMRSMLRIQRMLHDPSGRRTAAISWMEHRIGANGSVSSLIRPPQPLPADCVNRSHQAWIDAATPHLRRYTDYFQLLEQAQRPAAQLMDLCYDAVQTGQPLPDSLFPLNYLGLPEQP